MKTRVLTWRQSQGRIPGIEKDAAMGILWGILGILLSISAPACAQDDVRVDILSPAPGAVITGGVVSMPSAMEGIAVSARRAYLHIVLPFCTACMLNVVDFDAAGVICMLVDDFLH